jgi:hypothetical protein
MAPFFFYFPSYLMVIMRQRATSCPQIIVALIQGKGGDQPKESINIMALRLNRASIKVNAKPTKQAPQMAKNPGLKTPVVSFSAPIR